MALGINSVLCFWDATAIALAASLLSSGVWDLKSRDTLACFNNSMKVSSILNVVNPLKSKPFKIYPFPAPGAPAKISALGWP